MLLSEILLSVHFKIPKCEMDSQKCYIVSKASEIILTCLLFQLCWTAGKAVENAGLLYASEVQLSFLPLSHIAGSLTDIYGAMACAATVYFAQPDALRVC